MRARLPMTATPEDHRRYKDTWRLEMEFIVIPGNNAAQNDEQMSSGTPHYAHISNDVKQVRSLSASVFVSGLW